MTEEDRYSFQNIRKEIFPYLQEGLKRLLDEVARNEQVTRYQMRLAKKKIYDSCERKFIQKERLRRQLAEQYESSSSDEEVDYDYLGVGKEQLKTLIRERLARDNFNKDLLVERPREKEETPEETHRNTIEANGQQTEKPECGSSGLVEIKENQEEQEDRGDLKFNPIMFLANELQKIYNSKTAQLAQP